LETDRSTAAVDDVEDVDEDGSSPLELITIGK